MTIYRRDSVKVFQILSGRLNPNEINSLVQTQLLVLELNKDVLAWSNLNAGMATSFRSDVSKERRGGKLIQLSRPRFALVRLPLLSSHQSLPICEMALSREQRRRLAMTRHNYPWNVSDTLTAAIAKWTSCCHEIARFGNEMNRNYVAGSTLVYYLQFAIYVLFNTNIRYMPRIFT